MSKPSYRAEAKRVFGDALDLEESRRDGYVESACAGNAELLAEVRSLLAWHRDSTSFMNEPVAFVSDLPLDALSAVRLVGQRIGAWRIIEVIGGGGMGVVYKAERADAAFRREAALKVVRPGPESAQFVERFRIERETLAALDHPNIGRLFDGGTTESGQPYFVMELVEGVTVDRYCDRESLTVDQRLALFLTVCAGVQYAHENFVVHRDIKPDNILVTSDGTPKLLDFGVSKLLSSEGAHSDETPAPAATWLMTPEFASLEQVSGRQITTATDVYSLGVLLHVLLTGVRPYRLTGATPAAIEEQLLAVTLIRPSESARVGPDAQARATRRGTTPERLSKQLAGDLDAIILRALGRQSTSRYSTVEQLSQDIERHRTRHPIVVRAGDAQYVAGLFVRRHLAAFGVVAGLLLVAAAGVAAVLWQAAIATDARARAERRFGDVRSLAGALMFDVHDQIKNVPGTTPARQFIVQKAMQYLDSLAGEAAGDLTLQRELASAFVRLGDVQGNPTNGNVGDTAGALASYQRAIAIAGAVRIDSPDDVNTMRTLALAHRRRADVLALTGGKTAAFADAERSQQLYAAIAARPDPDVDDRLEVGIAHIKLGDLLGNSNFENLGQGDRARQEYEQALRAFRQLDRSSPETSKIRRFVGLTLERMGTLHDDARRVKEAATAYQESFEIRRALAEKEPLHADIQRDLGIAYEKLGNIQSAVTGPSAAVAFYRRALAVFERLAHGDPSNENAARTLAISQEKLADAIKRTGGASEADKLLRAALDSHRRVIRQDTTNARARCDAARVTESLGDALAQSTATDPPESACELWRESQQYRRAPSAQAPNACAVGKDERLIFKLRGC